MRKHTVIITKGAFTLLELIIVIIVIGILVSMALPQFTRVVERGRIAKCKMSLDMVRKAEGIYHALRSHYTTDLADLAVEIPEISMMIPPDEDQDWDYSIESVNINTEFIVVGTRTGGEYNAQTVNMDHFGRIGGTHPLR
jgi:prepilin-type N-terminal cleavage/methylation domain-containing protein